MTKSKKEVEIVTDVEDYYTSKKKTKKNAKLSQKQTFEIE